MDNIVFDLNGVFNEIITRLQEEGAYDRDAYYDMVDEILDEKLDTGFLTDDDDIEEMREVLKRRWPDAEQQFESGHDIDVMDDEQE